MCIYYTSIILVESHSYARELCVSRAVCRFGSHGGFTTHGRLLRYAQRAVDATERPKAERGIVVANHQHQVTVEPPCKIAIISRDRNRMGFAGQHPSIVQQLWYGISKRKAFTFCCIDFLYWKI